MSLHSLYNRFFVARSDYRTLLSYIKFSQRRLKSIRELIDNRSENVNQCFHKPKDKIFRDKNLFEQILEEIGCLEIFLDKCKLAIKNQSKAEDNNVAGAASFMLNLLDDKYIDNTFIYRKDKKSNFKAYIGELCKWFSFQLEYIPPKIRYDGSKSDLYVIIKTVSALATELEKFYAVFKEFMLFLETEGERINSILEEGHNLNRQVNEAYTNINFQHNKFVSMITPKHISGKDETGWLAEKRSTNALRYLDGYHLRLVLYLKNSREYVPSIEERSAQDYLAKIEAEILKIKRESRVYKRLYEAYLIDDQRTMAMMIKEQNPDYYIGYNLDMTAYCGVAPRDLIKGVWVHNTADDPYIPSEGYAQKLSKIILREGYRPSQRYTVLNNYLFGEYPPKNIFFYHEKHTGYGGNIALIGFSVREYCVVAYGKERAVMTPKNIPPKKLTLYIQNPDKLKNGQEFAGFKVQGKGYMSLKDYLIELKAELERLHTPFKMDSW